MEKQGNQRPEPGIRKVKMNFDTRGEGHDRIRESTSPTNSTNTRPQIRRVGTNDTPTIRPKHSLRNGDAGKAHKPVRAELAKTGSIVIPPEFFLNENSTADAPTVDKHYTVSDTLSEPSRQIDEESIFQDFSPPSQSTLEKYYISEDWYGLGDSGNGGPDNGAGGGNDGNGSGNSGNGGNSGHNHRSPRKNNDGKESFFKRHSKLLIIVLDIIIIVSLLLAAYFFFEPRLRSNQQLKQENQAKEFFREAVNNTEGELIIKIDPKEKAKPVPGEGYEDFGDGYVIPEPEYDENGNPQLRYIGRIEIDSVNIDTLIAGDHSNFSLRYSAGHATDSAEIGTSGQAVIYGHNFFDRNRVFSRLNEVKVGDTFYIDLLKGNRRLHYKVTRAEKIPAAELEARVFEKTKENRVLLVTCSTEYQNGVPLNRILVYGELVSTEQIPMGETKQTD